MLFILQPLEYTEFQVDLLFEVVPVVSNVCLTMIKSTLAVNVYNESRMSEKNIFFTELNAVHLKKGLALLSSLVFYKRLVKRHVKDCLKM